MVTCNANGCQNSCLKGKMWSYYICSLHFNLDDFDGRNNKLKPNAFQMAGSCGKAKWFHDSCNNYISCVVFLTWTGQVSVTPLQEWNQTDTSYNNFMATFTNVHFLDINKALCVCLKNCLTLSVKKRCSFLALIFAALIWGQTQLLPTRSNRKNLQIHYFRLKILVN